MLGNYRATFDGIFRQFATDQVARGLHCEIFAKVHLSNPVICQHGFGVSFRDNGTFTHNVCLVADIQRFPDVVVSDEDADIPIRELSNDAFDVTDRNRINTREWFVEENKGRFGR